MNTWTGNNGHDFNRLAADFFNLAKQVGRLTLIAQDKPAAQAPAPVPAPMKPASKSKSSAPVINGCKFLRKGIKDPAGKYFPVWYSKGPLVTGKIALTIYARTYTPGLPAELKPENGTDLMTDYFEKDRVRYDEGSKEFELLKHLAK
jgi:hypothetical protein